MSPLDIIPFPGYPAMFGRRRLVEAWVAAGSPPLNSAGRLYGAQKYFWDGWRDRRPGFNPADNPDDESQALAHVRFGAVDVDPTPERVRRLTAAGLIRPYSYEPWHFELPNIRSYAIVRSIPTPPPATPDPSEEDDMATTPPPLLFDIIDSQNKVTTVVADMENQTYFIVRNTTQKKFYLATGRAIEIHGAQPLLVLEGFKAVNS